jgi:hypothetical protein
MKTNKENELHRLQKDLNTIKNAGGIEELPFGPKDILSSYFLALGGLYILICSLYFSSRGIFWLGLLPVAIAIIIYSEMLRQRCSNASRRGEYKIIYIVTAFLGILLILYRLYSHELNIPYKYMGMSALFFSGVVLAVLALANQKRMYFLGLGIPLIFLGIIFPFFKKQENIYVAYGILFIISGIVSGKIMKWQLGSQNKKNANN